jgi:hypothetical protein
MASLMKSLFSFSFSDAELAPMAQFEDIVQRDTVLRYFYQHSLLDEQLLRLQQSQEQAGVLAQAAGLSVNKTRTADEKHVGKMAESESTKTYVITYYNPELHKAEVLEEKSTIRIQDDVKRSVEESLGMKSLYPLYTFIAAPLIRQEVVPWKLEQILSEREYGTPPPSAGGAGAIPVLLVARSQAELAAAKKQATILKVSVAEAMAAKEKAVLMTDEEIIMLEEAVKALRGGEDVDKVLDRLPPLSRARYAAVLRRKQLGVQAVIQLLVQDASFLKNVKDKLKTLGRSDLATMVRMLRNLQKKE